MYLSRSRACWHSLLATLGLLLQVVVRPVNVKRPKRSGSILLQPAYSPELMPVGNISGRYSEKNHFWQPRFISHGSSWVPAFAEVRKNLFEPERLRSLYLFFPHLSFRTYSWYHVALVFGCALDSSDRGWAKWASTGLEYRHSCIRPNSITNCCQQKTKFWHWHLGVRDWSDLM